MNGTTTNAYSVSEINALVKETIQGNLLFRKLLVKGEISNYKIHTTGIWYFSLKDERSRIKAIMFVSANRFVKMPIQEGMSVLVQASVGVYEQGGEYQLIVETINPLGAGLLFLQFEQLKKQLFSEGLFDDSRKISLPLYPFHIGLITAPTGAAVQDMITTIRRRWPIAKITVFPTLVQGKTAVPQIAQTLQFADQQGLDVLIVARGGGSIEDLWAFNDEIVARAIADCATPIVSGIGHETDTTIADFVVDHRAPTPTGAAEMVTPLKSEVLATVLDFRLRLEQALFLRLQREQERLQNLKTNPNLIDPFRLIRMQSLHFDQLAFRLVGFANTFMVSKKQQLEHLQLLLGKNFKIIFENATNQFQRNVAHLDSLSPLNVIHRGYAVLENEAGTVVSELAHVEINQTVQIRLKDGRVSAKITKKERL